MINHGPRLRLVAGQMPSLRDLRHAGRRATLPRVHMTKLTENGESAPFAWINPDEGHKAPL